MSETAVQLFSRLGAKEGLGDVGIKIFTHIPGGLKPSDVVEFSGTEGTGKSELLLNIAVQCTLPKPFYGKEVGVVYICTDYKFDVLRLVAIFESKLKDVDGIARKGLVKTCLSRIHVVRCNSSAEMCFSLEHLRQTFLTYHPEVAALILDNLASFYWIDKCRMSRNADRLILAPWIKALSNVTKEHHLVTFAAKPLLTKEELMLGRQWQQLVKHRFLLEKGGQLSDSPGTLFRCISLPPQQHSMAQLPSPLSFVIRENGVNFLS